MLITYTLEVEIDDNIKQDIIEINYLKKKTKLTACITVVRNSLNEGNDDMTYLMKQSNSANVNKSNFYNYLVSLMILNCTKELKDNHLESILNPENILNYLKEYDSLLSINTNLLENNLKKSSSLEDFMKINIDDKNLNISEEGLLEIDKILNDSVNDDEVNEELIKIEQDNIGLGIKLGKSTIYSQLILVFLVITVFGVIVYYLYTNKNKKVLNKKNKQYKNLINYKETDTNNNLDNKERLLKKTYNNNKRKNN